MVGPSTQLLQPLNLRGKMRLHSATALPPATASPTWHPSDLLYSNGSAGQGQVGLELKVITVEKFWLKTRYLGVWRFQILKACLLEAPKNSWRMLELLEGKWISKLPIRFQKLTTRSCGRRLRSISSKIILASFVSLPDVVIQISNLSTRSIVRVKCVVSSVQFKDFP